MEPNASNCIDTLEEEGCINLVRSHAIKPCKALNFETRFQCRATCGICKEEPVPIQLKVPDLKITLAVIVT